MSTPQPGLVRLRTGAEVPEPAVKTVTIALTLLYDNNPIAFYEAVEVARDPAHVPFGNTGAELRGFALLDSGGEMHDVTRDVIKAAVEGEDFDLHLVSPFADNSPEAQS